MSRSKPAVTDVGVGVFARPPEVSTSTRPTKREVAVITCTLPRTLTPANRGLCSSRIGKQHTNEVCGEITGETEASADAGAGAGHPNIR